MLGLAGGFRLHRAMGRRIGRFQKIDSMKLLSQVVGLMKWSARQVGLH